MGQEARGNNPIALKSTPRDLYRIEGLPGTVSIQGGQDRLLPIMAQVMRGWQITGVDPQPDTPPLISIEHGPEGFVRHSNWLTGKKVFKHPVTAVCDFIVDLIHAYLSDKPDLLCLHCAGVEFEQGIVLFPNTYRAGKSLLSVKLASLGYRVFSDDVVPYSISAGRGIGLGILPRLRLPLPDVGDPAFARFVDAHAGPGSNRYLYCDLPEGNLAPLGERAPVAAIAVLERSDSAPPEIRPADRGQILRDVILRNFSRRNSALDILAALHRLVEQTPCCTLTYDTPQQAAELLAAEFGAANGGPAG